MASSSADELLPAAGGPTALVQAGLAAIAAGEAALGAKLMERAHVSIRRRLAETPCFWSSHSPSP